MSAKQVNIDKWESIPCECGKKAKLAVLKYKEYEVRGWKCASCKRSYIHPEDSLKISKLEKLKKEGIKVTVGMVGHSLIIRIPKELGDIYGLHKGSEIELVPENLKRLEIVKE